MKLHDLKAMEKDELIEVIDNLQLKLKNEKLKLHLTRQKLSNAKVRLRSIQDTVKHQRSRILELYRGDE
jgi:hypothetical protein